MRAWTLALWTIAWASMGCSNAPAGSACGRMCDFGRACCPTVDGQQCVDIIADNRNCGACGNTCGIGQSCQLGQCAATRFDAGGIGDAGPDTGTVMGCGTGRCLPPCNAGFMCCPSGWVLATGIASGDARTDPSFTNCHTCGTACDPVRATRCGLPTGATTGTPQCMCGSAVMCNAGEMCVATTTSSFGCFNTQTDPSHCGAMLTACAVGEACVAGACTCMAARMRCPTGQSCGATGCIDTMTDPMNCGTIGHACRAGEQCTAGTCRCGTGPSCPGAGAFGNCGQICCSGACVYASDANCGACGTVCTGSLVCGKVPFGAMPPHCGTSTGFFIPCDPPPPPTDAGTVMDAGVDANVDAAVDAGLDAGTDASFDANADTGG